MPTAPFSRAEIEAGRRLFASEWRFIAAAASSTALPPMRGVEIAFAGRSNAGKSSLVNALVNRRALARTSHAPGRTQELIFFSAGARLVLVDLPGYGYARAPKAKVAAWTNLIDFYLKGRASLVRVYVLIDARHGPKAVDEAMFDTLDASAVSYQIVLTKADQLDPAEIAERAAASAAAIGGRLAAFPDVLVTSARTGAGIAELRAAVARLLAERR